MNSIFIGGCPSNYLDLFLEARLYRNFEVINFLRKAVPSSLFDISVSRKRELIQKTFIRLIKNYHRSYSKFFINLILYKNKLTGLHEIKALMRNLSSSPYYNENLHYNPLFTCIIAGKPETAKLLIKYGAEIPAAAKASRAYRKEELYSHPMFYCVDKNISTAIDLLHKYGVYIPFSKKRVLFSCMFDLLNISLNRGSLSCADVIRKILIKEKRLTSKWLENNTLYLDTAFKKKDFETIKYVFEYKLYDRKNFSFLDYCTTFPFSIERHITPVILNLLISISLLKPNKSILFSKALINVMTPQARNYCHTLCKA